MANIFLSFSENDREVAVMLTELLKEAGQSVFMDQSIVSVAEWSLVVEQAITTADAVVVLLSRNSNRSKFVADEVNTALQRGHPVIPVLLDDEATQNFVWPLVSDRYAIRLDSPNQLMVVVQMYRLLNANKWNTWQLSLEKPLSAVEKY